MTTQRYVLFLACVDLFVTVIIDFFLTIEVKYVFFCFLFTKYSTRNRIQRRGGHMKTCHAHTNIVNSFSENIIIIPHIRINLWSSVHTHGRPVRETAGILLYFFLVGTVTLATTQMIEQTLLWNEKLGNMGEFRPRKSRHRPDKAILVQARETVKKSNHELIFVFQSTIPLLMPYFYSGQWLIGKNRLFQNLEPENIRKSLFQASSCANSSGRQRT